VSFRTTLSDLGKYAMTRSIARSLCDSWAACLSRCVYCRPMHSARLIEHSECSLPTLICLTPGTKTSLSVLGSKPDCTDVTDGKRFTHFRVFDLDFWPWPQVKCSGAIKRLTRNILVFSCSKSDTCRDKKQFWHFYVVDVWPWVTWPCPCTADAK